MTPRTKRLFAAVCLLSALTTACGPAGAPRETGRDGGSGPAASPVPRPRSAADFVVPLQRYELTSRQYAQVQRARMAAVRQCMRRYGITLATPAIREVRRPHVPALVGWLGDRNPSRYGYRGPAGFQADRYASAARGGTKALFVPDRYGGVYEGSAGVFAGRPVPPGGCHGEVMRRLDQSGEAFRAALEDRAIVPWKALADIEGEAARRVASDHRYRQAEQHWRACMKRSGHPYATPADAEGDPRWAGSVSVTEEEPERPVSRAEIAVAVADESCREEVNLPGVALALHIAYQKEAIDADATRLDRVKRLLDVQLGNSADILGAAS
ncbi:hypothetical protein ACFPM3_02830 [Streptomyces coeruleoprunus]|uniref:Lipoprotein n=1 Tax=Streptomyces coeruleoprunus TaxID=285563 RepID=A0ABV9X7Q0_9ACTN